MSSDKRPNVASTIPRFLATSATGYPEETTYCTASALYSSMNLRLALPTVIVSLKISVHCGHCPQDRERSTSYAAEYVRDRAFAGTSGSGTSLLELTSG
jgi:hypothetical protein